MGIKFRNVFLTPVKKKSPKQVEQWIIFNRLGTLVGLASWIQDHVNRLNKDTGISDEDRMAITAGAHEFNLLLAKVANTHRFPPRQARKRKTPDETN